MRRRHKTNCGSIVKLIERIPHSRSRCLNEPWVVVIDAQLVNAGRAFANLSLSGCDILSILTAT
jgi:hypothetical protein